MILSFEAIEETFTFTSDNGEVEIHILSGRLRAWLLKNAMHKVSTLVFPEQTIEEIIETHGLEDDRMASMTEEEAREPVIVGLTDSGTHIVIDGGHRRWFWAKRGKFELQGWLLPVSVWSNFQFNPNEFVGVHGRDGSRLPQRMKR